MYIKLRAAGNDNGKVSKNT